MNNTQCEDLTSFLTQIDRFIDDEDDFEDDRKTNHIEPFYNVRSERSRNDLKNAVLSICLPKLASVVRTNSFTDFSVSLF
jgi:hypothetical protein